MYTTNEIEEHVSSKAHPTVMAEIRNKTKKIQYHLIKMSHRKIGKVFQKLLDTEKYRKF